MVTSPSGGFPSVHPRGGGGGGAGGPRGGGGGGGCGRWRRGEGESTVKVDRGRRGVGTTPPVPPSVRSKGGASPPPLERLVVPHGEVPLGGGGAGRALVHAFGAGALVQVFGGGAGRRDGGRGRGGRARLLLKVCDDHRHVAHGDGQLLGGTPVHVLQLGPGAGGDGGTPSRILGTLYSFITHQLKLYEVF